MPKLYGFASAGVVPVRGTHADSSEMVTQLLLGEAFEVISIHERWVEIRVLHDGYEGWLNRNQCHFQSREELEKWIHHPQRERSPFSAFRVLNKERALLVPLGSYIIIKENGICLGDETFDMMYDPIEIKEASIIQTGVSLLGIPYIWGGRSDLGLDCSGFIQLLYQLHGYEHTPRDSSQQLNRELAKPVEKIDIVEQAEERDVLFFGDSPDSISHVGIYMGEGTMVHASGTVRLDNLSYKNRFQNPHAYNDPLVSRLQYIQPAEVLQNNSNKTELMIR